MNNPNLEEGTALRGPVWKGRHDTGWFGRGTDNRGRGADTPADGG